MQRIQGETATVDNLFTEGNPTAGVPATVVTDDWLNGVQEELLAVIEDAGLDPSAANLAQLKAALYDAAHQWAAVQAYTPVALTITDGAATWDLTAAPVAEITLTADVTLTVTNAVPGTSPILRITQDATGGWSVIWPSGWLWAGKVAHDVTTDAGAVDLVQVDVGSDGTVCARGDSDYGEVS